MIASEDTASVAARQGFRTAFCRRCANDCGPEGGPCQGRRGGNTACRESCSSHFKDCSQANRRKKAKSFKAGAPANVCHGLTVSRDTCQRQYGCHSTQSHVRCCRAPRAAAAKSMRCCALVVRDGPSSWTASRSGRLPRRAGDYSDGSPGA